MRSLKRFVCILKDPMHYHVVHTVAESVALDNFFAKGRGNPSDEPEGVSLALVCPPMRHTAHFRLTAVNWLQCLRGWDVIRNLVMTCYDFRDDFFFLNVTSHSLQSTCIMHGIDPPIAFLPRIRLLVPKLFSKVFANERMRIQTPTIMRIFSSDESCSS